MLLNTSECICCNLLAKFPQSITINSRKCELCKDEKHFNSQRVCCYKKKNYSENITLVRFEKTGKNWKEVSNDKSSNNPTNKRKSARLSSVSNKVNTQDKAEKNINLKSQIKRKISDTDKFPRDIELKKSRFSSESQSIHNEKINISESQSTAEQVKEQPKKSMQYSINNRNKKEKIDNFHNNKFINSVNNNNNPKYITRKQSLSYNIDDRINNNAKTKVEPILDTLPIDINSKKCVISNLDEVKPQLKHEIIKSDNICTEEKIKRVVKKDVNVFSKNITTKTSAEEEEKLSMDNNSFLNENISTKQSFTEEKENIDCNLDEEIKDNDFGEIILKDREDDGNVVLQKDTIEFTLEVTKNSENNENFIIDAAMLEVDKEELEKTTGKEKKHISLSISYNETVSEKEDAAMTLTKEKNISQVSDKLRNEDIIGETVFKEEEEERVVSVKELNKTIVDSINNEDNTIGIKEKETTQTIDKHSKTDNKEEIILKESEEMEEIFDESCTFGIEEKETPEIIDEVTKEDIREESSENMKNDLVENREIPKATTLKEKEEKEIFDIDDLPVNHTNKIKLKPTAIVSDSYSEFEFFGDDYIYDDSNRTESINIDCDPKVSSVYNVPTEIDLETKDNLDNNTSQLIDCDGNNLVQTMVESKENLSLTVELVDDNSLPTMIVLETEEDISEKIETDHQETEENIDCYDVNDDNDDSKTEEMRIVKKDPIGLDSMNLDSDIFDSCNQLDTHGLIHNLDAEDYVAPTSSTYSDNVTAVMSTSEIKDDYLGRNIAKRQKYYKCDKCDRVFDNPHVYSGHFGAHNRGKKEKKEKRIVKERNNISKEKEKEKIRIEEKNVEKLCIKEKKKGQRKEQKPKDCSNQENSTVEAVSASGSGGSFVCIHCRDNMSFNNENELTYHVMTVCKGVKEYLQAEWSNMVPGTVGCSICGLMFGSSGELNDHKNDFHTSKDSQN